MHLSQKFITVPAIFLNIVLTWGLCAEEKTNNQQKKKTEKTTEKKENPIPVTTLIATFGNYKEYAYYLGELEAKEVAQLRTETSGIVNNLKYAPGKKVNKNESLCDIDTEIAELAYRQAVINKKLVQSELQRLKRHLKSGTASETSKLKAELELKKAEEVYAIKRKIFDASRCLSPLDGVVLSKHVNIHEHVDKSKTIYTVGNINQLKLKVGISEADIFGVNIGTNVLIDYPKIPGSSWKGKLSSLSQSLDQKTRTYLSEITLENNDKLLKPGMTVRAKILRLSKKDQIVVPTDSIVLRKGKKYIMLAVDGFAKAVPIKILSQYQGSSLITEGINPGDNIIVSGQHQVVDQSPLKILDNK